MKAQEKSKQNLEFLSSLSDDKTPFKIRFALNSLITTKTPKILDQILLLIEYSQLISQLLLFVGLGTASKAKISLVPLLRSLIAVFTPGYLLGRYANTNNSHLSINYIIPLLCYFFIKYSLGTYVAYICQRDDYSKPRFLVTIWKIIVKLQARMLYYVVGSFLVELARDGIRGKDNKLFGVISGELVGVVAILLLVVEFVFSVMITKYFFCMLPSSGMFLAAKDSTTEIITLIQKLVLHIMMISIESLTQQTKWTLITVQVLFCAIRNYHFYYTLPFYSLPSLTFQSSFLMIKGSLTVGFFLHATFKSGEIQDNFVWIIWIITSILSIKFSHAYLKNTTLNYILLGNKKIRTPGILINKIIMIKQILKHDKKATQICSRYDLNHLLSKTISLYTTKMFGATPSSSKLDFQDPNFKGQMKKAIAAYLEENLSHFPRSNALKLFIGYYYAKKLKLYELGIKYFREAQHSSSSFVVSLNSFLVFNSCQEELIKSSKDPDRALDMDTYSRSRSIAAKMELSIIKQAELQEELYQEMTQNSVDLGKMYKVAQVIKKQKEQVRRFISKLLETIPEYYTDPLLKCAHYFACLNFDFKESKKYQNLFSRRYAKYAKHFQSVPLCEENLYQRFNDVLIASAEKADLGVTLYNSRTLVEGRGRDLKGLHYSSGVMPILSGEIVRITKASIEAGDRGIKGKIIPYFIYHFQNGHISPTLVVADTNPYLGNGVQDFMFSRLITLPIEHLVLLENGKMECCTKGLADALDLDMKAEGSGLKQSGIHIKQICQEFEKINQAFNMIAFPGKYQKDGSKLTQSEAQELYTLCTTTGKSFQFHSINSTKRISYHCKIQNFFYGNLFLKFVTLEKATNQDDFDKTSPTKLLQEEDVESDIEKEQDIIQVPATNRRHQNTLISSTFKITSQTENPISTERESAALLLTTQRNQSSPKKHQEVQKIQSTEEDFEQHRHHDHRRPERLQTKTTNDTQKQTDRIEVNIAYTIAVNAKYYAPRYRFVTIFMYLLFIFLLIFQMISKVVNNTNIGNLDGQGQALLLLEQRTNDILWAHGTMTLVWEFTSDFQDQTIFPLYLQMPTIALGDRSFAQTFSTSNRDILSKIQFLPAHLQKELFKPNLKYYEDPNDKTLYTNLNFFQSLDRLSETLLNAVDMAVANSTSAIDMLEVYLQNDINDILVENDYLFEQLQDSINSLGVQVKNQSYVYLFVMISLIGLVGFGLFAFIFGQYWKDKQNLFMITKVNHNQVQNLHDRVSNFKNLLIREEDIASIDIEETYYRSRSDSGIDKYSKEQWSRNKKSSSQKQTKMGHLTP